MHRSIAYAMPRIHVIILLYFIKVCRTHSVVIGKIFVNPLFECQIPTRAGLLLERFIALPISAARGQNCRDTAAVGRGTQDEKGVRDIDWLNSPKSWAATIWLRLTLLSTRFEIV
jgi:hypothetical protein